MLAKILDLTPRHLAMMLGTVLAALLLLAGAAPARAATDGDLSFWAIADLASPIDQENYWYGQNDPAFEMTFSTGQNNKVTLHNDDDLSAHTFPFNWEGEVRYQYVSDGIWRTVDEEASLNYPSAVNWAAGAGGTLNIPVSMGGIRLLLEDEFRAEVFLNVTSLTGNVSTGDYQSVTFYVWQGS